MLRILPFAALAGSAMLLSAAHPGGPAPPDPELYVSAGCAGCHGPAAAGDIGPTLAGTRITFEAFLEQLRSPRGMMPTIAPTLVSDEQARGLFDFVSDLDVPEGGAIAGSGCPMGHHGRGHHAGAGACRHHGDGAAHQGQGRGRGGACRHGACRQGSQSST